RRVIVLALTVGILVDKNSAGDSWHAAGVHQDADVIADTIWGDDVGMTVVVQIANRTHLRGRAHFVLNGNRERPAALAREHGNIIAFALGTHDVGNRIVIDIGQHHSRRLVYPAGQLLGRKSALSIAVHDGDVRVADVDVLRNQQIGFLVAV